MATETESNRNKNFEGGRVLDESIDDYALDGRRIDQQPLRLEFERLYGPQGVGWDVIERVPSTVPERIAQNMGLLVLDVVISPAGDEFAKEHELMSIK